MSEKEFRSDDVTELTSAKLAESARPLLARYDDTQLAILLSVSPAWVWETDKNHRFSFVSQGMEAAIDVPVTDMIGQSRREFFFTTGELADEVKAHLDDIDNHRAFSDFVFLATYSSGQQKWISVSGVPRFDNEGAFCGHFGVTRLLSEEAVVQSGLRAATDQVNRLETLVDDINESVPFGIAIWDENLTLTMFNQNFCDMMADGISIEIGESYEAIIRRVLEAGKVVQGATDAQSWLNEDLRQMREDARREVIYPLNDGRWIMRRFTLDPNGKRIDIRIDVTNIKAAEFAAKSALENAVLARTVINDLSEPVFVKDQDLNFIFCNDAFAAILGRRADEFPGKRASDFVIASEAQAFETSETEVLTKGGSYELEEDHFEGGQQKTRILRRSRITTDSGKNYVAGYMFDVTAMRQRESAMAAASRRAESADKAKSDFLSHMSHEIRTPMNGVLSMTELLVQSTLDDRQRVFVDIIRKSGESLLATINNILDFTRIESGSLAMESNPFSLRTAVEDVAEMQIAKATEKETDVLVDIDPALPATITGDEGRFRQIISNLLSNAIKFTENGHIKIAVKGNAERDGIFNIAVAVSDTGIGIPADKLDQIFDSFSQINISDISKPQGTGLGLSIVAKLTKIMGGLCRVQSTLGKGSTFFVDIPMACTDARAPSTPVSDELRAKRVLIIDANAAWRECLAKPLKQWGFDVAAVPDPETAIAMAKALNANGQQIDLVVIGCNLPEMSCIDIGHLIDSQWPGSLVTKLFLAPFTAAVTAQTIAKLNVHSVMTLPVTQAALYHHVTSALMSANRQPAEEAPLSLLAKPKRPNVSRVDVLIAEDNPINQLVMTQILTGSGLNYQIVANGELAVEALSEMQPSLILMDIGMPKLNGFEATKAIRAMVHLGGDQVPIIGVTANAACEDRESCLKAGMNDHLAKPISPEALLAKIADWMPKHLRKTA